MRVSVGRKRFQRREKAGQSTNRMFWFGQWNTSTMAHLSGEKLTFLTQQRLTHLYQLLLARPESKLRMAVLANCVRLPAVDKGQRLLRYCLVSLAASQSIALRNAAASAIFGNCVPTDAAVIEQAVRVMLPRRAALQTISGAIQESIRYNRRALQPIVRALLDALASDPLTIELRCELAMFALPWDELASLLSEAAVADILHAGVIAPVCEKIEQSSRYEYRYGKAWKPAPAELHTLEECLAASPDERLRRIALALLLAQSTDEGGWSPERRARLERFREDSSPLVAAKAQFTIPTPLK